MKKNLGNADRIIRIILAAFLAFLYLGNMVTGTLGIVLAILGGVLLLTGLLGFCPLYKLVGLSSCPLQKQA